MAAIIAIPRAFCHSARKDIMQDPLNGFRAETTKRTFGSTDGQATSIIYAQIDQSHTLRQRFVGDFLFWVRCQGAPEPVIPMHRVSSRQQHRPHH